MTAGEGASVPSPQPCKFIRPCREPARFDGWCRAHAVERADGLFRRAIKRRDPQCRRCGKGTTDCAHIFTRSRWQTRWDPANAVGLCRTCHAYMTERPDEWRAWCILLAFHGNKRAYLELEDRSTSTERGAPKLDLAAVLERLEVA
jgi:hypothetical protein